MSFESKLAEKRELIESFLKRYMENKEGVPGKIQKAMEYSLFAGGKRLRPILTLAGCEICGGKPLQAAPFACAVEMIHTYSLIHDDLPAMDNDDYRRGKPTNHKVFGEGIAVLAGDGLLNCAFELMLGVTPFDERCLRAARLIAEAGGREGMIGGQVLDLENEGKEMSLGDLKEMHKKKTGALICASLLSGALIGGCSGKELSSLRGFGENLGLAFQIQDDILDVIGEREVLGKDTGSDASKNKPTYVSIIGLDESRKMLESLTAEAKNCIEGFGDRALFLKQLTDYLMVREF